MTEYCKCEREKMKPVKIDEHGKVWCDICGKRMRPSKRVK